MVGFLKCQTLLRFVTLVTLLGFMPSSVGIWNFAPQAFMIARADEAKKDGPPVAGAETPGTSAVTPDIASRLTPLSEEQLKTITGGPGQDKTEPTRLAKAKLPDFDSLVKPMAEALKTEVHQPDPATNLPKPAALAQAQGTAAPQPGTADDLLAQAATSTSSGDLVSGALTYLQVQDKYPRSDAARQAMEGLSVIASLIKQGRLTPAAMSDLESRRPAFNSLHTAESRYTYLTYFFEKGDAALRQGAKDVALDAFRQSRDIALAAMQLDIDHPLQADIVPLYFESAQALGAADTQAATRQLQGLIQKLGPCMTQWVAMHTLGTYFTNGGNSPGEAFLFFSNMLEERANGQVDSAIADPNAYAWLKARIEYFVGSALYNTYQMDAAYDQYDRVTRLYPNMGEPYYAAACAKALIIDRQNLNNPNAGLKALADYLNTYPSSKYAAAAMFRMGTIYFRAEDFQAAMTTFGQVVQRYPDTNSANAARHEMNYLSDYCIGTVEALASNRDPETLKVERLAQKMCGPVALHRLLALKNIQSSEEELATLAKTDETGSSMQGLVRAAEAKGLKLIGVQAPEVKRLTAPFIAYVRGNHFVLVTDIAADSLVVADGRKPEAQLTLAEFQEMWDGKALVGEDSQGASTPLQVAALETSKGGELQLPPDVMSVVYPKEESSGVSRLGGDGGAGLGNVASSSPAIQSFVPAVGVPGATDASWTTHGGSGTSVQEPGVHLRVHNYQTAMMLEETEMGFKSVGPLSLSFERVYMNAKGHHRDITTNTTVVWGNNIGGGWSHNLNSYLRTNSTGAQVTFYDKWGASMFFGYSSTAGGYDTFTRSGISRTTEEIGYTLKRNTSTGVFAMYAPSGIEYDFSAPTSDANKFCRIETMKDTSGNTYTFNYDGANGTGKLTKITPPTGDDRYLQFSYSGNLITKTEFKKSTTVIQTQSYAYDGSNELTKVTDNDGLTVQYHYATDANDGSSRFIDQITDKKGLVTNLTWVFDETYSGSGVWEADEIDVTDVGGLETVFARSISTSTSTVSNYSGATLLSRVKYTPLATDTWHVQYADNYIDASTYDRTTFEYDAYNNLTKVDRTGNIVHVQMAYTSTGRISTGSTGDDTAADWDYASGGLYPTKVTDRDGTQATIIYDGNNRVTKVTPPSLGSNGVQYGYDANGQITTVTNPSSQTVTVTHDARGQVTSSKDPLNNETKYEYDDFGHATKVTDPRNKTTYYYYATGSCSCGSTGLLTKAKDPLNNETMYAYDNSGNNTKVTDALGRATDYFYDNANRLTKVESPSGSGVVATMAYDAQGLMTSQTDFLGKVTNFYYDFKGQLTRQSDSVGDYVQQTYDNFGNLSTVTDGSANVTDYDYDNENRLTKVNHPGGETTVYIYDVMGRVTKVGAGSTGTIEPTEYFFSGTTQLLTKVRYTAGANTYDANRFYDDSGRLTKLTDWIDGTNGLQYAYDSEGRLTKLTDYDGSHLDYTYDASGNVITMSTYHGSVFVYTYTDTNQVSTVTSPGTKTWTYSYNAIGQPTQVSIPNGMTTNYAYDNRNRMTKIDHKDGAAVDDGFTYALDASGNITTTIYQDNAYWSYLYDGRYRLTKAERYDSSSTLLKRFTYTYSAGDNMTTKQVYTPPSTTDTYVFAYNTANELTKQTVGGTDTTFGYDAWGRQTSKSQGSYNATYYYNYGDKLTKVSSSFPGEGPVTYKVDANGKRRERSDGTNTTGYNWEAGWNVIEEESPSGTLTMTYAVGLADISGSNPAAGTYRYYFRDNIGSVRRLRDASKASMGYCESDPYGNDFSQSGATTTHKYAELDWDSTAQLDYAPFRYYDPKLARWLGRDPVGSEPNLYDYVENNPISSNDPLGSSPVTTGTDIIKTWKLRDSGDSVQFSAVLATTYFDNDEYNRCYMDCVGESSKNYTASEKAIGANLGAFAMSRIEKVIKRKAAQYAASEGLSLLAFVSPHITFLAGFYSLTLTFVSAAEAISCNVRCTDAANNQTLRYVKADCPNPNKGLLNLPFGNRTLCKRLLRTAADTFGPNNRGPLFREWSRSYALF